MAAYDDAFYTSINQGSLESARVVVPLLHDLLDIGSVADFGCGQGAWLQAWAESGLATTRASTATTSTPPTCASRATASAPST